MPPRETSMRNDKGFTFFELTVVLAIGLIVTGIGLPRMNTIIANMKVRSSMTTASSFLQNVRMMAIKRDRTVTARHFNRTQIPYSLVYYAKEAADTSSMTVNDSQVEMEAPITPYDAPTGPNAPSALTNTQLGLISGTPETGDPSFNSRGLPCVYSGGTCNNGAFIKYYKDNRINGAGGWAAISISPAGRIKRWFWNGSVWTD
jgi:prepilin-type N-terminal cleavage/methylation domain-containing protein